MKTLLKRQVLANLDYDAQVTDKKEIISTPNMQQSPEKILKLWWNVVIDVRFQDHEFGLCLLMVFLSQVFSPMAHVLHYLRRQHVKEKSSDEPHQNKFSNENDGFAQFAIFTTRWYLLPNIFLWTSIFWNIALRTRRTQVQSTSS